LLIFYAALFTQAASAFVAGNKITDQGPVIPEKYQIKPDKPIIMPRNLPTGF